MVRKRINYPLRRRRQEGDEEPVWYGDGQGATNGSAESVRPTRPLLNGFPIEYGCATSEDTKSFSIRFAYEIAFEDPEAFWNNDLHSFEWGLLYIVSSNLGLRECEQAPSVPTDRRSLQETRVVSLRSTQQDAPALSQGAYPHSCETHEGIFLTHATASCFALTDLPPGYTCVPMTGFMRVAYEGLDRALVHTQVLNEIELAMVENGPLVRDIENAVFIGEVHPGPQDDDNNTIGLATGLSISAVFLFVLGGFVISRRRRRSKEGTFAKSVPIETLPTTTSGSTEAKGAFPTFDSAAASVESAPGSDGSDSSDKAILPDAEVASSASTHADDVTQIMGNGNAPPRDAAPKEAPPTPEQAAEIVAGLAFLPSTGNSPTRPKSQTLKKQRKKKKIKKRKLTRVNSREQVQSMTAITEEEADGSDSEYSWVTDESGANSRDPSPVPSRDNSPSRTSQGEDQPPTARRLEPRLPPPMWI